MKITRDNLIQEGFDESKIKDLSIFKKGVFGLVYNFNVWLLCNCETGIPLNDKQYVSTMEEVLQCYDEYKAMIDKNTPVGVKGRVTRTTCRRQNNN